MSDLMKVGSDWGGPGTFKPLTATTSGAQRVSDAHGRFHDAARAGRLFSGGGGLLAINNVTFTTATTGNTATPIIGLWNPKGSNKYLSVLQATLAAVMTALQATGPGGYAWMVAAEQNALTLGSAPYNRSTLLPSGSVAKVFAGAALTGLVGALAVMQGSALGGGSAAAIAFLATQVALQTQQLTSVENFDGSLDIPPGGLVGLFATTTPVGHSVVPSIAWEEMPFMTQI